MTGFIPSTWPAGGTNSAPNCQRRVIVAPPYGNTFDPEPIEVLHKGCDTLVLAVQANIPSELFDYLTIEKARAEEERQDVLVEYSGVILHLKAHGGNGYSFITNGGPMGATWFLKKPNSRDKWGIRVSFGSQFMAYRGLAAARAHLDDTLNAFGIRFGDTDVSISRVDFCVDVLAPDFELNPERFVMHSSSNRRDYVTGIDKSVNGKSGRTTSVTIGGPRNRQIIIYDKRAEIAHSGKSDWWNIWNHTRRLNNSLPLHPKDPSSRVWRVEFRAGKDLLKDTWGIRTWADLYTRFGDLTRQSGEVVRYTDPNPSDPNRARWPNHPLWEILCAEMNDDLCEMRSGSDPNPMKEVHKEQHISLLMRNILGTSLTVAALKGENMDGLEDFFDNTCKELKHMAISNQTKTQKQLNDAKARYIFLVPPTETNTKRH